MGRVVLILLVFASSCPVFAEPPRVRVESTDAPQFVELTFDRPDAEPPSLKKGARVDVYHVADLSVSRYAERVVANVEVVSLEADGKKVTLRIPAADAEKVEKAANNKAGRTLLTIPR